MHRAFALACSAVLCLGLATPSVAAEMYRWVDEDGVTHFSQTPPLDGDAERVEPSSGPPGASGDASMESRFEKLRKARAKTEDGDAEPSAESEEVARVREENCNKARDNLRTLTENRNILSEGEDGEPVRLSEEQRQAKVQEMRDYLDQHCSE